MYATCALSRQVRGEVQDLKVAAEHRAGWQEVVCAGVVAYLARLSRCCILHRSCSFCGVSRACATAGGGCTTGYSATKPHQ